MARKFKLSMQFCLCTEGSRGEGSQIGQRQAGLGIAGGQGSHGTALIRCELGHTRTMSFDKVHNLQHLSFLNAVKGRAAVCLSDPLQAFLLTLYGVVSLAIINPAFSMYYYRLK